MTIQITAPHFCAGLIVSTVPRNYPNKWPCEAAAPIIGYMVGWSLGKIRNYCGKKGWTIKEVRRHA